MKENIHEIGNKMKAKRKLYQMTLKMLSEYTGLSVGFLSNVERNLTSPTIENLKIICEALNTTIYDLISTEKKEHILVRKKEAKTVKFPQYNQSITYIDFGITETLYEIITISPGKITDFQEARHKYDENCTVLSGTLTVKLDSEIYELNEGDSLYIKRNTPHLIYNQTDLPCTSYWIYHRK